MKILVTGPNELVASRYLIENAKKNNIYLTPGLSELDLLDSVSTAKYLETNRPDTIINFLSYTDVKKAQLEAGNPEGLCWKTNVVAVDNMINVCKNLGIFYIQISTDLIFAGKKTIQEEYFEDREYNESLTDLSWYAQSKLKAERLVKNTLTDYAICRIAYEYRPDAFPPKPDFLHNFLKMYDSGNVYPLFNDNAICPTEIDTLIRALNTIVLNKSTGVFHIVSSDFCSHYEFAEELFKLTNRIKLTIPKTTMKLFLEKNPGIPRPIYSRLSTLRTQKTLNMRFNTWKESLHNCVKSGDFDNS